MKKHFMESGNFDESVHKNKDKVITGEYIFRYNESIL